MIYPHLFFSDPVYSAPTIGTMLMGLSSAIVGVLLFVRKKSLIGETLAHAAYPGVTLAVFLAAQFSSLLGLPLWILIGAFCACMGALFLIDKLTKTVRVSSDAALCFTLASFFGIGVTIASLIQFAHPKEYRQIQAYLYGQAATMTEIHIAIYGVLFLLIASSILFFYKEIQLLLFDESFAKAAGIPLMGIKMLMNLLIVLAIIIGIRSVGVVLMSAMLIGPAIAARCFTERLTHMFILSGFLGMCCALCGTLSSVYLSEIFLKESHGFLPTGPMIVLMIALLTFLSLLFAPKRGFVMRYFRVALFRLECVGENILKTMWQHSKDKGIGVSEIKKTQGFSKIYLLFILFRLQFKGFVKKYENFQFILTEKGRKKGARLIRLHRLWELYLVEFLGAHAHKVHRNAEEMEHIITEELEEELNRLLDNPKVDPHHQPIPAREDGL